MDALIDAAAKESGYGYMSPYDLVSVAESLVLSYAMDYRREDVARAMVAVRKRSRQFYDEREKKLTIRVIHSDNFFYGTLIYLCMLTADPQHPYLPTAEKTFVEKLEYFDFSRSAAIPDTFKDPSHLGEGALVMGGKATTTLFDNIIKPLLAEQTPTGAWAQDKQIAGGYGRHSVRFTQTIQAMWRYDYREMDKIAKAMKLATR
jgi:hypothetical protein